MLPALARFVALLRKEGVRASPGEVLDAARALAAVGIEDRGRVRAALSAALVKTRGGRPAFDRVFDTFFAPPPRGADGGGEKPGPGAAGDGRGGRGRSEDALAAQPAREPRREGRSGTRAERQRDSSRQTEVRARLAAARGQDRREAGRLRKAPRRERPSQAAEAPARRVDLTRPMASGEERALAREIPRLIDEIRRKPSRRQYRSSRGRPWPRASFRENLSRGGVPFVLPRRWPRPRRPRVVLLVDVSWSAARATAFFLWMASAFLRLGRRAQVLLFVDRPVEATAAVARWAGRGGAAPPPSAASRSPGAGIAPAGRSFADLLAALPGLDPKAPSDYGRALHALLGSRHRPRGRDTLLVVLGDARTNRYDPLPWALEELRRRCGAVLWLVPEPESRWGTADSALPEYLPHVDVVVEATDLAGLADGLRALLRRL